MKRLLCTTIAFLGLGLSTALSAEPIPTPVIVPAGLEDVDPALAAYAQAVKQNEIAIPTPEYQQQVMTDNLLSIWRSFGYYDAKISVDTKDGTQQFTSHPGALYQYGFISHQTEGEGSANLKKFDAKDIIAATVKTGSSAHAASVIAAQQSLREALAANYCFFNYTISHQAFVNHKTQKVDVRLIIHVGPPAIFGKTIYKGLTSLEEDYVQKLAHFEEGTCFKRGIINDKFLSLQRSGFFSTVDSELPKVLTADGSVDVTFHVAERAHRTIKAGADYSTDIGPGLTLGWEHRNFLHRGEKFNADLSLGTVERSLKTKLKKPFFLRDDQSLTLGATLKQEDNDAYETTGLTLSSEVERKLNFGWLGALGTAYSLEQIKDQKSTENFALLSFPAYVTRDARDNPLDPTKGWTLRVDATPFINTLDTDITFYKTELDSSYFFTPELKPYKPTLAMRAATGTILGISSDAVPATQRYFVGGGGSVRGYGYQLVGPLDAQNDPLGGRSYIESSFEARMRLTDDYGVVAFVDAGNVFDSAYPDFDDGLLVGAGIGLRYFSNFGPLRFDAAIPLDRRARVDDAFQLYFSIGQAF